MSTRSRANPVRRRCQDLEARLRAGSAVRAEDFLTDDTDPEDAVELIYTEFVCREEIGPPPDPAEYLDRFPEYRGPLEEQFLVHRALRDGPGVAGPSTGQSVGPYELVRELGRGSRGAVFAARDRRDGRTVALKLLLSGEYSTPDDLALFQHEAAVLGRLDHPNLIHIYEAGTADGRPYLALECVEGPTLAGRAGEFRSPLAAAGVVEVIARAVHHAHLQGVVHRDLKPGNVLLTPAGDPKVTDFGLAKRLDAATGQTRTGDIIGTLGYMAPEQAAGTAHRAGPPADVYALGAVLYELLTGRPPFGPEASVQTLYRLMHEPPTTPRRLTRDIPRDLETVCLKCLEKNPDRRYPSALALADDLARFAAGRPVVARPVGVPVQAARWAGRHPTSAALAVVLSAAATAAMVGMGYHNARLAVALTDTEASREQAVKANQGLEAALQKSEHLQQETKRANAELRATVTIKESLEAETRRQNDELARRLDDTRRAMYALQLGQLPALWLREPVRARALLADARICPPELRDFTWRYFHRLCWLDEQVFQAHQGEVRAVAFLPDGRLMSGGADGRLRYWNQWATPGRQAGLNLTAHSKTVTGVAVLPGGLRVATAGLDRRVKVWPVDATTPAVNVASPSAPNGLAASSDGNLLAGPCADGVTRLWRVTSGELVGVLPGHDGPVNAAAFAPDGRSLVTAGADKTVRVWDVAGRRQTAVWVRHAGPVLSVAYTSDGRSVVSTGEATDAFLWDARTGVGQPLRGHLMPVRGSAASPAGDVLATVGADSYVKLWDAGTGQELTNLMQLSLRCVAFTPDGKWVAAGDQNGKLVLYRVPSYPPPSRYSHDANIAAVVARPGGGAVTGDADGHIKVWNPDETDPVALLPSPPGAAPVFALSPDGQTLAVAAEGGEVVLWDTGCQTEVGRLTGHAGPVTAVAFRPDGQQLATGGADKTVRVWDLSGRRPPAVLTGHTAEVMALAYAPDGRTLASGGGGQKPDGRPLPNSGDVYAVRLWNAETGTAGPVLRGHTMWVLGLAFSPDGRTLASGSRDRTVRLWNPAKPGDGPVVLGGYTNWVHGVSFAPDGRTLATASGHHSINSPGEVKLCDPQSGYVRAILREFQAPAAFTADGRSLLVGTRGGVAELVGD